MTVGNVITNESIGISKKLDKVTATQTAKKVYTIETNGVQSISDYQYAGYDYSVPIIDNVVGYNSVGQRLTKNDVFTPPSQGKVSNGNFSCSYTFNTTGSGPCYSPNSNLTFQYSEDTRTGNVTVKFLAFSRPENLWTEGSVTGNKSGNVISFLPFAYGQNYTSKYYIVGVSF